MGLRVLYRSSLPDDATRSTPAVSHVREPRWLARPWGPPPDMHNVTRCPAGRDFGQISTSQMLIWPKSPRVWDSSR